MTQPHLEKIFYHYVRQNTNLFEIVSDRFFSNKALQECFKIDQKWYLRYSQVPSMANVIEGLKQQKIDDVTEDEVKIIFQTNLEEYDEVWLKENAESWIELKQLNLSFFDAASLVKGTEINPDNIKSVISSVKEIFLTRNSIDFSFNSGIDFFNAEAHNQPTSNTFTTGYPFLDACMDGGWELGSLIFFMAPPKRGKCCVGQETIKIRNKQTGKVIELSLEEFYKISKNSQVLEVQ